jgi:hypothetical protein
MSTPTPGGRRADRAAEWRAPLTLLTGVSLGFLALSGLAIWLLPFSRAMQVTVLVHTAVALAVLVPVTWYCVRHWRLYRDHALTHIKLLGYLGVGIVAVCAVSGIVLTWQPVLGTRLDYLWRAIHRWSTVAIVAFVAAHLVAVWMRDRARRAADPGGAVRAAARMFGRVSAVGSAAPFALVGIGLLAISAPDLQRAFPPDYELWQPTNPLYKDNRTFAPSLARTPDNGPIDVRLLAGSEGCGTAGCHEQIAKEWLPSAHRYAAMDKAFQAIQLTMARQNGPTSTRYCAGCHDPISLFSGTKNISADEAKLTGLHGYQEGISCLACHAIRQTDIRGNAQYTVHAPPRYIGEIEFEETGGTGWRLVRDFLIRAYPAEHVSSLSKVMFKKPEYCAACHKQFVDEEVNKVGWVQLQNQFDNWRMSKWARDRSDPARTVECRECHMPLVASTDPAAGDPSDYNRTPDDRKHRSHRFLGANQLMPELMALEGGAEQSRLTHEWLKGRIAIPEIAHKWAAEDVPAVSLEVVAPDRVRAGETINVRCVITSRKVGHDFPTGPLDMIQSWIELVVRDEQGAVVFDSGTVDEKGFIEPGSFLFKAEPVDQYGNLIDRHNLWEMVGVRNRRALFPGFSDTAEYTFVCPTMRPSPARAPANQEFRFEAPASGRLTIEARLRYRKIDQFLLNYMRSVGFFPEFDGKRLSAPITDLHEQRRVVEVEGI